jgi:hypothetical protein
LELVLQFLALNGERETAKQKVELADFGMVLRFLALNESEKLRSKK